MESTDGQSCMNGRAEGQSLGADEVVGYTAVLPSSLEALKTEAWQLPLCNMDEGVNGDPTTVWPPEKIGQSACHTDISHPANTKSERRPVTMLDVTAAISVSLVIPLNFCLTRLSG